MQVLIFDTSHPIQLTIKSHQWDMSYLLRNTALYYFIYAYIINLSFPKY
jgi:hypothetical protein